MTVERVIAIGKGTTSLVNARMVDVTGHVARWRAPVSLNLANILRSSMEHTAPACRNRARHGLTVDGSARHGNLGNGYRGN